MGVLECDRKGCGNIMCTRYSHTYGYICDECFEEMKVSRMDIETFMNTPKSRDRISYDYDEEFERNDNEKANY